MKAHASRAEGASRLNSSDHLRVGKTGTWRDHFAPYPGLEEKFREVFRKRMAGPGLAWNVGEGDAATRDRVARLRLADRAPAPAARGPPDLTVCHHGDRADAEAPRRWRQTRRRGRRATTSPAASGPRDRPGPPPAPTAVAAPGVRADGEGGAGSRGRRAPRVSTSLHQTPHHVPGAPMAAARGPRRRRSAPRAPAKTRSRFPTSDGWRLPSRRNRAASQGRLRKAAHSPRAARARRRQLARAAQEEPLRSFATHS